MPIDYRDINSQPMHLPFDGMKFKKQLFSMNVFKNKKVNELFVEKWVNILQLADNTLIGKDLDFKFEHYCLMTMFNNKLLMSVTFDIDKLLEIIDDLNLNIFKLPISQFYDLHEAKSKENILYSDKKNIPMFSNDPIIILISECLDMKIVIDGNHRVSYLRKNSKSLNIEEIEAYIINDDFLKKIKPFTDTWSLSYFFFTCELNYFLRTNPYKHRNKKDIFGILEMKYFTKNSCLPKSK